MMDQIIVWINGVWDFIWEERAWTIASILAVVFGIPAYFFIFGKKKNGKVVGMTLETEKNLNEYIEFLKKQLPQQPNADVSKFDEQIQTLLKEKEELEQRLQEAAKKNTWKQPVADAVKEFRFDDALKLIEEANKDNDEISAEAHYEQGNIYHLKIDYKNALYHFELAAKLQPLNSLYLNQAGSVSDTLGKYDEAIKYYTKALENETKESSPKAILLNNIGLAWYSKGEYDKAIEYYEEALTIDKKFYGEVHPKIAIRYNNIGGAWKSKGEYDFAIEYYEEALTIDKKFHGEVHPEIAIDYNNIGSAWNSKGEYDKAIEYFEKALAIFNKYLGENHPSTKTVAKNLKLARKTVARNKTSR